MTIGILALRPDRMKPETMEFLRGHPSPIAKALLGGGFVMQEGETMYTLPYTAITFPG